MTKGQGTGKYARYNMVSLYQLEGSFSYNLLITRAMKIIRCTEDFCCIHVEVRLIEVPL